MSFEEVHAETPALSPERQAITDMTEVANAAFDTFTVLPVYSVDFGRLHAMHIPPNFDGVVERVKQPGATVPNYDLARIIPSDGSAIKYEYTVLGAKRSWLIITWEEGGNTLSVLDHNDTRKDGLKEKVTVVDDVQDLERHKLALEHSFPVPKKPLRGKLKQFLGRRAL